MKPASLPPRAAAAALTALPWLTPFTFGPSPQTVPWLVTAACALLLWLLAWGVQPGSVRAGGLAWCLSAVVAWAVLSQLSLRPEAAMLAGGLVLVWLAAASARASLLSGALQAGLLLAAAASAAMGLLQYFGAAAPFAPWISGTEPGWAFANLRQTNQFATFCWMGVAVVLFGTLRLPRAARALLLALLAAGSAATASRTGMVEGAVLLALCFWRRHDRRERVALGAFAAVCYLAAAIGLPPLLEAVTGAAGGRHLLERLAATHPCASRLVLWSNVLQLVALHPWTGWGWGNLDLAHYLTLYPGARFCDILDNAHNLPLHLAVELGVPAALAAVLATAFWVGRQRPWAEAVPLRQLAWTLLGLLAVHSMLEYPLWYGPFQLALGICLGWLLPALPEDAVAAPRPLRVAAVATGLLAATAYAAWDYARISQIYLPPAERQAAWRDDALAHARRSWLFSGQARFADVTLAEPTRADAPRMYTEALQALRHSPEPRVIERVIESALYLGREDEALLHLARYRAAFPQDYARWQQRQRRPSAP